MPRSQPEPRAARHLLIVTLSGLALGGLIALRALNARLAEVTRLADVSPDRAAGELTTLLWWTSLTVTPLTLLAAVLVFRYARQTSASGQCPPPGAIVAREGWLITGRGAQALAVAGYTLAALLAVLATTLPVCAWWLAART